MTCPDCGADVIHTPTRLLDPRRSRVGRYLPDNTEITPNELRQGVRAHHLHHCQPGTTPPATPAPEQQPLF
jgi:hypothetical protein